MITTKLLLIAAFILCVHAIETLAYASRLAGARVGQVATAISLFNILVIFSRFGIMFQQPATANLADQAKLNSELVLLENQYRFLISASTIGTIIGIFLLPTFISIFTKSIFKLAKEKGDIPTFIKHHTKKSYIKKGLQNFHFPNKKYLKQFSINAIPKRLFLFHIIISSIYTTGILSALYAGALVPDLTNTASHSSGLINGIATMLLVIFVDPKISVVADEVAKGRGKYVDLKVMTFTMILAKLIGTLLAQFIFIPGAYYIAWFAQLYNSF